MTKRPLQLHELDPKALLWAEDVQGIFRCSYNTLYRWRLHGTGPKFVKLGKRVAYYVRDLREWSESRRFNVTTEARHS